MKKVILFFLVIISILIFNTCKKDKEEIPANKQEEQLFESFQLLNRAYDKMIEIGVSKNLNPREAMYETMLFLKTQSGIEKVEFFDSTYLYIYSTGGYVSTLRINEIDNNGLSVYRGGPSGSSKLMKAGGGSSSNLIENKKVLLFAANRDDFYTSSEFQNRVVNKIQFSPADVTVTTKINDECTPEIIETFDQYGLVILDAHGVIDGFQTGLGFSIRKTDIPSTIDSFRQVLQSKIGFKNYTSLIEKRIRTDISFIYDPLKLNQTFWDQNKAKMEQNYSVEVTSKGIRELIPDLSNTVIFANNCYSGFNATSYLTHKFDDPVQPAWLSKNPIALYAYEAERAGLSYKAPNEFCKQNEDTLIRSLFYDMDSTGMAHLYSEVKIGEFPWIRDLFRYDEGPLKFKQYGHPDYSYFECEPFYIDSRDQSKYETFCTKSQIWFAQNLRYNAPGSLSPDGNAANILKYGRLYNYDILSKGQGIALPDAKGVQGICPDGWRIPSRKDLKVYCDEMNIPFNYTVGFDLSHQDKDSILPRLNRSLKLNTGRAGFGTANTPNWSTITYNNFDKSYLILLSNPIKDGTPAGFIDGLLSSLTTPVSLGIDIGTSKMTERYGSCRCVRDK